MSIQVECPRCHNWYGTKKGGGEVCTKCGQKIPSFDRVYRLRQRVRQPDGTVVQHSQRLGRVYKEEAERLAFEAKVAARKGSTPREVIGGPKEPTWREIIESYLRKLEVEGRSPKYQRDSRLYLERMGRFWGFELPISKLDKEQIQEFRASLMAGDLGDNEDRKPGKTATDRHHAAAKAAWEYAATDIPNPFKQVKLFNPHNGVIRYLSKDQKGDLLRAALAISRDLFAIIVVALSTGLRKNNILRLRRDQVDFERGLITVTQKGNQRHVISIGKSLLDVLRSIPDNGTEWFWVGNSGTPYHVDWRKPWKKAKLLAGIPDEFRFHDLRHDAGTSILRETGNIKMAKEILGHSDIRMTERYAHVIGDDRRAAVEAIDPLKGLDIDLYQSVPQNVPQRAD